MNQKGYYQVPTMKEMTTNTVLNTYATTNMKPIENMTMNMNNPGSKWGNRICPCKEEVAEKRLLLMLHEKGHCEPRRGKIIFFISCFLPCHENIYFRC